MYANACVCVLLCAVLCCSVQTEHKIQSAEGPLNIHLAQVPKMLYTLRHHWAPSAFVVSFKVTPFRYSLSTLALPQQPGAPWAFSSGLPFYRNTLPGLGRGLKLSSERWSHFVCSDECCSVFTRGSSHRSGGTPGQQLLTPGGGFAPPFLLTGTFHMCPDALLQLETDQELLLLKARAARKRYDVHAVVANELLTRAHKVVLLSDGGEEELTINAGGRETTGGQVEKAQDIEELVVEKLSRLHSEYHTRSSSQQKQI